MKKLLLRKLKFFGISFMGLFLTISPSYALGGSNVEKYMQEIVRSHSVLEPASDLIPITFLIIRWLVVAYLVMALFSFFLKYLNRYVYFPVEQRILSLEKRVNLLEQEKR